MTNGTLHIPIIIDNKDILLCLENVSLELVKDHSLMVARGEVIKPVYDSVGSSLFSRSESNHKRLVNHFGNPYNKALLTWIDTQL